MCQMIVGIVIHILDHIWTMIPKHISFSLYKYFESIKNVTQNGRILSFFHFSSLKNGDMNISLINNNILKAREENGANIEKYKIEKEAEANKALYTQEYIQLNMAKSKSNNTKYYFSGKESALGGLMTKIFGDWSPIFFK